MELQPWERLEDLQCANLRIIQDTRGFCFGVDAVLLSNFARPRKNSVVLDMCSGSAVIPILLSAKHTLKKIYAVELLEQVANCAKRSVKINNLDSLIEVICGDVAQYNRLFAHASIDYITVNPPYTRVGAGLLNPSDEKKIARHEVSCDLDTIFRSAKFLLKFGGKIALVHKCERLVDIFCAMREYYIEPKRMAFFPDISTPKLVLVEGCYGGKVQLNIERISLNDK